MSRLFDWSGKLAWALASLAKVLIGVMILLVCADVAARNLGFRPLAWQANVSEYILLYAAFLPMPWLVRIKGHVFVEFLRGALPPRGRDWLARLVYLVCTGLCLYLFWYAAASFVTAWQRGTYETRVFDMPKTMIFLPMMLAFLLSALEWLRYLAGVDSLYDIDPLEMEGL